MRLHGFMCVRDEADILPETLESLLGWIDALHVFDTGSTDESWEIVQDFARRDGRVRPFCRAKVIFCNSLRGMIFESVRASIAPGDWIARLDADEIYHVSPREFLASSVRPHEGRVFAQEYEFVITQSQWQAWERGEVESGAVTARQHAYVTDPVPEQRFFRFRRGMHWGPGHPNPYFSGLPARSRIPVRHYRWRSPQQMLHRLRLRRYMAERSGHGIHWNHDDIRRWIYADADPRLLIFDDAHDLVPRNDPDHLGPRWKQIARATLYRSGAYRLVEPLRRRWRPGDAPTPADDALVAPAPPTVNA